MKKYLATAAAMSLIAAPAMAANPAANLSVAKSARAGSAGANKSELGGGNRGGFVVAAIAAVLVAVGIIVVANEDDEEPDSN